MLDYLQYLGENVARNKIKTTLLQRGLYLLMNVKETTKIKQYVEVS